jgi:hypothetical protein
MFHRLLAHLVDVNMRRTLVGSLSLKGTCAARFTKKLRHKMPYLLMQQRERIKQYETHPQNSRCQRLKDAYNEVPLLPLLHIQGQEASIESASVVDTMHIVDTPLFTTTTEESLRHHSLNKVVNPANLQKVYPVIHRSSPSLRYNRQGVFRNVSTRTLHSMPNDTTITGVVNLILFSNEENHYCVAKMEVPDSEDRVTVVGTLPRVQCGETLQLFGHWVHHHRYGFQFKITRFLSQLPASVHEIRTYLGSGIFPGVGKAIANKLVDHFGIDTIRIISEEPGRLQEAHGIGERSAELIANGWNEKFAVNGVMMFFAKLRPHDQTVCAHRREIWQRR